MKKLIIPILLISNTLYAQTYKEREREVLLTPTEAKSLRSDQVNQHPEIYLHSDSILQERNVDTGMYSDSYYTANDQSRFSASVSFSQDYEDPSKVYTVDMIYLNKFNNDYEDMWWGLQLKRTTAKHNAIAEDTTATNGSLRAENQQFFTIVGAGLGHRFKTLSEVFDTDRVFETINVYMNYVFHLDNTDTKQYQGYGYTAEYGLHYRSNESLFYGTKLSYNWAQVERPAESDEKLLARSLVFGWLNIGFEIGYYF
jgi:hypothetical protein